MGINFTADYDADNASTLAPVKPPLEVNWFRVVLATLVSWMTSVSGIIRPERMFDFSAESRKIKNL